MIRKINIKNRIVFLDKYGWVIERFKSRPITNFIRILLLTRKITTVETWEKQSGVGLDLTK